MRSSQSRNAERGSVLIVAFLFAIMSLGYATTLVMTGFAVSTESRYHAEASRAKEAAESGIHHAAAYLNAAADLKKPEVTKYGVLVRGEAGSTRSQRFEVDIQRGDSDGADNDLDGDIDEEDEKKIFEIRSVGYLGSVSKTIRVTAYRDPIILPAAVYLEDDTPNLTISGAFKFSGKDVGISGGFTGVEVPGLGTTGDPSYFTDNMSKSTYPKIIGEGDNPSVYQVDEFDHVDTIIARALASDPIVLGEYPDGHYGTTSDPKVVVTSSDFNISGSFHGCGLLIIEAGQLAMSGGSIKWQGLVIVRSDAEHQIDNGSINIDGGIMLAGADFQDDDDENLAAFNVQYSREAMELGTGPLGIGRIRIFNWRSAVNSAPAVP